VEASQNLCSGVGSTDLLFSVLWLKLSVLTRVLIAVIIGNRDAGTGPIQLLAKRTIVGVV
jgi:hypothetical protein